MAKFLIVGLQLLILRVCMPAGDPFGQNYIKWFSILDDVSLADCVPLAVFINFLLLTSMQMVDLSTDCPPEILICIFDTSVGLIIFGELGCR